MSPEIHPGDHLFLAGSPEPCGAVEAVRDDELVLYLENAGEAVVPLTAVRAALEGKVILDPARLPERLRQAIAHAHDAEAPGA
jgi:hypothetical protein